MKKALYSLFVILLVASMSACKGNKAERQADEWLGTKAKATAVPQNIGAGSTLTSCSYGDKTLSYRIETTADSLAAINIDPLRRNTGRNWKTNLNSQEILEMLLAAKAIVKYTYISGTDSIVMTLTSDDFK